jgi:hypothetical protein
MRGADTFTESLFTMRKLEDFVRFCRGKAGAGKLR